MPRATEEEVTRIIDTAYTDEQVTPFLTPAGLLVDAVLSGEGYSEELLTQIECWLAAHFVAVADPRVAQEGIGDLSVTYDGKTAMGLNQTRYGQQVLILDWHGRFRGIETTTRSAELRVLG